MCYNRYINNSKESDLVSGHVMALWSDFEYEGDIDDIDYKEIYTKRLEEEEEYDNSLNEEWNHLYEY